MWEYVGPAFSPALSGTTVWLAAFFAVRRMLLIVVVFMHVFVTIIAVAIIDIFGFSASDLNFLELLRPVFAISRHGLGILL